MGAWWVERVVYQSEVRWFDLAGYYNRQNFLRQDTEPWVAPNAFMSVCKCVCLFVCVWLGEWGLLSPFFQEPEADQLWCPFAYIRTEPTQKMVVLLYKILLTRSLRSLESSTEQAESKLALSLCTCLLSHWHSPFFWKKGLQRELLRFGLSECFCFPIFSILPLRIRK